jgi:malate dehydrogenase
VARPKIVIIGAGAVGAQAAYNCALKELGDIVLVDINEGSAKGKALDIFHASPISRYDVRLEGGKDYSAIAGADIIMITAGVPRKPGMTREQLLETNAGIVLPIAAAARKHAPSSILLIMTNPLDAMTYLALKASGFPRERVLGQAGALDSSRFRAHLAKELGVSVDDVHAMVLGSHGEEMVPLPRYTSVAGVPIEEFLPAKRIEFLAERVRNAGAEIVQLLQTGSAFFAPGAAIAEMAESIIRDHRRVIPCSVYLDGEFGIHDTCVGVPAVLGRKGLERVLPLKLGIMEKTALRRAARSIAEQQKSADIFLARQK